MSGKTPHNSARAVPVRVKKKSLKKLTNAERLEVENAKMEERLRSLRQTIEKEKEQRRLESLSNLAVFISKKITYKFKINQKFAESYFPSVTPISEGFYGVQANQEP